MKMERCRDAIGLVARPNYDGANSQLHGDILKMVLATQVHNGRGVSSIFLSTFDFGSLLLQLQSYHRLDDIGLAL